MPSRRTPVIAGLVLWGRLLTCAAIVNRRTRRLSIGAHFALCLLFAAHYATAATISGAVLTPAGDPAASVTVSFFSTSTHVAFISDPSGRFTADALPPGAYTVTARSPITGASAERRVFLHNAQTLTLTLTLGTTPVANSDLPFAEHDALSILRNRSEITPSLNSYGQREQNNGFLLDGVDNNNTWLRGPLVNPPLDAVASATLAAGYIPAAYGRAAGAAVSLSTRTGTDEFHGDAFEYLGATPLDARNFFDSAAKPSLASNQFGGSLGGPVLQHKWYFFFSPELRRDRDGVTVTSTVPTQAETTGDFSASSFTIYDPLSIHSIGENLFARNPFPNNRIPGANIPQASRNLAALYPGPTAPGLANNYAFVSNRVSNSSQFALRSDYALSPAGKLSVRLVAGAADGQSPSALPGDAGNDPALSADAIATHENWLNAAVAHTATISPTLINTFHAAVSVDDLRTHTADPAGMPYVSVPGFASLGAATAAPFSIRQSSYEIEDTAAWKTRRHSWQFGFQAIRRHADGDASDFSPRGDFFFTPDYTSQPGVPNTGDSIASLLLGYPSEVRQDVQFAPYRLRAWEWAGFVQDEFHLSRRLTVNAGLRYSLYPPVTEADNRMVNFNFNSQAPALSPSAPGAGSNKHAFAPRIGFALDLSQAKSVVLRGNFSQAWDAGQYLSWGSLARNPPYASRLDAINGTFQVGPNLSAGLPTNGSGAIYAIQPVNDTPYSDQWSLALAARPHRGLRAEIGGMGSMGIHLPVTYNANTPYPAPTPYPYPRYPYEPLHARVDYLGFAGGSTYYAGTVKVTGSVFQFDYTYGKSLDDATAPDADQQSRPPEPQYVYNPRGVRSPSTYDVTQRLIATAHYRFKGVRLYAIATVQSGLPFTPELAVNTLNNGGFQLPNRIGDGALPTAFAMPALYQYGNSGFDILRGPGLATLDAAAAKSIPIRETLRLQLRLEAYNLLNRANFALPNRILGLESTGVIDHTLTPARRLQLAARFEW